MLNYDFSGIAQPDDDISIGAGFWQGGLSSDTYIYFVSNGTNVAAAYDFFGSRQAANDISLDSNSWQGAVASDTRLYFVSDSSNEAVAYDFDGNRQSSDDISLGGGAWVATSRSDDRLYFVNDSVDIARAYDFDGNRQADDDITLGTGNWRGGLRSDTRIYFVNGTNAIAYDYSGVRQSADDIALGAGRWQGGATIFGEEAETDAVLDITADSQDIEGGASTDVTFSFDKAITDFDADDVDLDVGTKGTLTDNGDDTFTMPVTAPSTGDGDMTVSVDADVVSPGNNADSIVIAYTEPEPVVTVPSAPTSLALTKTHNSISATFAAPTDLGGGVLSRYDIRIDGGAWVDTGLDLAHTFSTLGAETEYTVDVAGVNSAGRGAIATLSATTDAAPVVITVPSAPTLLALTKTHNSISATFAAPTDLGNGTISRYDIRIDGGAWVDTGLDLLHTFSSLEAETEYTIDVAAVNSAGRGATASLSATTDAAAVALSFGSESINNQAWVVGTAASVTLPQATGGEGTITYSLSPTLPAGKTFVAGTRVLSGNPTGRFTSATFTYTATDGNSDTVELTFTVVVTAVAITFASNIANQSWVVGTAVNVTLPTASGGVGSFGYSLTPALPAGVTRSTRVVSGTPTATATVATYTYTATDSEGVTQTQTFTIVVAAEAVTTAGGRLYFISTASDATSTAHAYDFDGARQSADDILLGAGFWQGGLASDTYIYFVNNGTNTAVAYDFDGARQTSADISLDSNSWQAAVASDTRLYFVSDSGNTAVAYDFDGARQSSDDISLGTGAWAATSRSNNRLFFVNDTTNVAVAYDFDGNRQSGDDISLGTGGWRGGLSSDTRLYFVNGTNAIAYDFDGTRQSVMILRWVRGVGKAAQGYLMTRLQMH